MNEAHIHEMFQAWARSQWGDRPAPENAWLGFKAGVAACDEERRKVLASTIPGTGITRRTEDYR